MEIISKTKVLVNTINRGNVIIDFPFIALEKDGITYDVAPKTKEGEKYLSELKKLFLS